ncbi:MAG TPA: hypothetical protein VG326_17480 [Tepidisphaeraceae bacterium]|jgi:hypothetical protein|nr:hypothetical protein [Tepidisphaeraceae bacterium]
MRDVFPDEAAESRSAPEFATNDAEASRIRDGLEAQQVCPFCGAVGDGSETLCPKCAMENNAAARKATKLRIGPWYVLQNRNPAAPGMKWETLLSFVRKGRIKPQSVVRGPTTHQLWRFAAHVKGLSREFGVCYSCGGSMERGGNLCPHCNRLQEPPVHPDTLLEGSEPEPRTTIYRELPLPAPASAVDTGPAPLDPQIEEKLRLVEELLKEKRERGEASDRIREDLEREKEAAARDRELVQRDRETIARERDAVNREKEAIERDRLALARDREAARRERELRGQTTERAADSADRHAPPPKPDTSVWDLSEPDIQTEAAAVRKMPPPLEKPANASIGAKARPPRDGGFLSAKDLAAAFKLNHQMALAARELKGQGDEGSAKGDDTAPRFKSAGPAPRRGSRRTGGKFFLVFLLLFWSVVAVVAVPAWRAQAIAVWARISHGSKSAVPTMPAVQIPERGEEPPAATTDPAPEGLAPSSVPIEPQPATLPAAPQTAPSDGVSAAPTTAPVAAPAPAPILASPPAPVRSSPPATTLPAAAPPAPTTAAAPVDSPLSPNAQAKILYHQAMDAEFRNDMAGAVRIYEQIEKLPQDAWPSDLELRIKLDKAQVKQK